jgi:hypothetical protein
MKRILFTMAALLALATAAFGAVEIAAAPDSRGICISPAVARVLS